MPKYKNFPLKIKFFANIEPLKFSGRVDIVNPDLNDGDGCYHGIVIYKVIPGGLTSERTGQLEIHLPNVMHRNVSNRIRLVV